MESVSTRRTPAKPPRPIPPPNRQPEPQAFTLQLIRPVAPAPLEEKRGTVSMEQIFDAPPPGCAPEHVITVRLLLCDPYELQFNGLIADYEEGEGWQDRARSVLTIRATSSPGAVGSFTPIGVHQPVAGRNPHPILLVPVSARHAIYMELDGRVLLDLPAPERKGGQH